MRDSSAEQETGPRLRLPKRSGTNTGRPLSAVQSRPALSSHDSLWTLGWPVEQPDERWSVGTISHMGLSAMPEPRKDLTT
jgi:hypothetical protein